MSPAKQKSNEKQGVRTRKAPCRQASAAGSTAAYNPVSGTFHALGRFRSIDDTDDNPSSNGVGAELDCISNNGSCSGESEDQVHINGKEKHGAGKVEAPPGLVGDLDKRDKLHRKNERKHQRQKERRAQELRDKCIGYLMSRKLEALSQQLVLMGFSKERATMALILNDGHVEQSVSWLLEGCEGQTQEEWNAGGDPKIDISEELGQIAEIEKQYKVTRSEIERAIVSCEGDLDKALESLQVRIQNSSPGCAEGDKLHGISNGVSANSKEPSLVSVPLVSGSSGALQTTVTGRFQATHHIRQEDIDPTHTKGRLQGNAKYCHAPVERHVKGSPHESSLLNPVSNLQRSFSPAEQRGYSHGSVPSLCSQTASLPCQESRLPSYSQTASLPYVSPYIYAADSRANTGLIFCSGGTDAKMIHNPGRDFFINTSLQKPVPPQFTCTPAAGLSAFPVSCSPGLSSTSWHCGSIDGGSPSSVLHVNSISVDVGLNAGKKLGENLNMWGADLQGQFNSLGSSQSDSVSSDWNSVSNLDTSSLVTSSGLYTGWGCEFSRSSVDWSMGPMDCDYKKIDWSMSASPSITKSAGFMQGVSSGLASLTLQEKCGSGWNLEESRFQGISGTANLLNESSNEHGILKAPNFKLGSQDKTRGEPGVHEWTSPFTGKDLFTLPHAVPSQSL